MNMLWIGISLFVIGLFFTWLLASLVTKHYLDSFLAICFVLAAFAAACLVTIGFVITIEHIMQGIYHVP